MIGKKSLIAAAAALFVGIATLPVAHAEFNGHQGRHGGGGHGFAFLQGVTLTTAQQAQVKQLVQTSWTSVKPLSQQLRTIKKQIADQLASTATLDPAAITALQQQAGQIEQQIQAARLTTALQVRALLTPAQLTQSAQVHAQLANLHSQERAVMGANHPTAQ